MDHKSLKWILNMTNRKGRLARWRLILYEFNFYVIRHAGVKHEVADALSRLPTAGSAHSALDNELLVLAVETTNSNSFDPIRQYAAQDDNIPNEAAVQHFR